METAAKALVASSRHLVLIGRRSSSLGVTEGLEVVHLSVNKDLTSEGRPSLRWAKGATSFQPDWEAALELDDVLGNGTSLTEADELVVDIVGVKVVTIQIVEELGEVFPISQEALSVYGLANDVRSEELSGSSVHGLEGKVDLLDVRTEGPRMSRECGADLRHELVQRHASGTTLELGCERARSRGVWAALGQVRQDFLDLDVILLLADLFIGEDLESFFDGRGVRGVRRGCGHENDNFFTDENDNFFANPESKLSSLPSSRTVQQRVGFIVDI